MIRMRKAVLTSIFLMVIASVLMLSSASVSAGSGDGLSGGYSVDASNLHWEPLYSLSRPRGTFGTIGEWKFDGNGDNEYTGSIATCEGSPLCFNNTGGISDGYAYVGTDSDYLEIAHNPLYDLPDEFTIEFWFRQRADQSFEQDLVVKEGEGLYNFRVFRQNDGSVIAGFTDNASYWNQVFYNNDLAHDVWHYVAYTKSLSSHAYYLDGTLVNSEIFPYPPVTAFIYPGGRPIMVGESAVDTDIDELRIGDMPKTAGEISNYYNSFAPVADAGADQSVSSGSPVTLDGTGSTITPGTTVTYQWTQTAGTTVTIVNPTAQEASFTAPAGSGTLTFQLAATNNADQESIDTCTVTVTGVTPIAPGTYYVDINNGDDANDGTAGHPWKTFHYALTRINGGSAGDYTLIMETGTYKTGSGLEPDSVATLSQNDVAIIGTHDSSIGAINPTVVIDGTGSASWSEGLNVLGSDVVIEGVSITNFTGTGRVGIAFSGGAGNRVKGCKIYNNNTGIEIDSSSNCNVWQCQIYQNATDGLNIMSSTGETFRNTIYRNAHDGIGVFNCSPEIKRNEIYDNDTGVRVEGGSPEVWNNIIYETTAYHMTYGIVVKDSSDNGASPIIYHNTIDGGSGDGIAVEQSYSGVLQPVIKYNIITRCDVYGIDSAASAACAIDYNDVWQNSGGNYNGCAAGANDISEDPQNGPAGGAPYALTENSPCIDAIPTGNPPADPVTVDFLGYIRPRQNGLNIGFDMGAYEYVPIQTTAYTFTGGTGVVTDYALFSVPLDIGTGQEMRNAVENVFGAYDPTKYRMFGRTASGDIEMNTPAFASLNIKPGIGFWGISKHTGTVFFEGLLSPDAVYYDMELPPGWSLFSIPWPNISINLGNILVSDGVNRYAITDGTNTLTEQRIWDYTGTGPNSGYEIRNSSAFGLATRTAYFIKVLGSSNIKLSIPPNNNAQPASIAEPYNDPASKGIIINDVETPPFPGGPYEPIPDIRANGKGEPVRISQGASVSIKVTLDPGSQADKKADWWIAARTPFDPPFDWYSYVYPTGWQPGIHVCAQANLFQVSPAFEVLNMPLPPGDYTFHFAVDENADGLLNETWKDSVNVQVE